jgi:hypothetical protein
MEKLLKRILYISKKMNDILPESVIIEKDLEEENENIEDYVELLKRIDLLVTTMEHTDLANNKAQATEQFVELSLSYSNVLWHVQQIDVLLKKIMGALPPENLGTLDASYYSYKEYCDDMRRKDINKLDKTFEKMIKILEKITLILLKQDQQKITEKRIQIKNFIMFREKFILLMNGIEGLLR